MTMNENSSPQGSYGGRDVYGQQSEGFVDPYAVGPASSDPFASDSHASDPYALDPYAGDPQRDAAPAGSWAPVQHHPGAYPPGPPQFGAYQPPLPSSGAGITGFVLGLVSLVLCGGFASVVGIFFSVQGMKETGPMATPRKGGRGLSIAGLVLNIIGLVVVLCWLAYFAFALVMVFGVAASGA